MRHYAPKERTTQVWIRLHAFLGDPHYVLEFAGSIEFFPIGRGLFVFFQDLLDQSLRPLTVLWCYRADDLESVIGQESCQTLLLDLLESLFIKVIVGDFERLGEIPACGRLVV